MDRISSMRISGHVKAKPFAYGAGWWTERRDNSLLHIMRTYNDIDKASRVLGAPVSVIERRLKYLAVARPN